MDNMQIKSLLLSLSLAVMAFFSALTLAYYSPEDTARNAITASGISIELVETRLNNGREEEYPLSAVSGLLPAMSLSKIARVKNLEEPAWIRARVQITVKAADGTPLPPDGISLNIDETYWIPGEGEYYYYYEALSRGAQTKPIFMTLSVSPGLGNEYQDASVAVSVTAEAVQRANNPIPTGGGVMNVYGWGDGAVRRSSL